MKRGHLFFGICTFCTSIGLGHKRRFPSRLPRPSPHNDGCAAGAGAFWCCLVAVQVGNPHLSFSTHTIRCQLQCRRISLPAFLPIADHKTSYFLGRVIISNNPSHHPSLLILTLIYINNVHIILIHYVCYVCA